MQPNFLLSDGFMSGHYSALRGGGRKQDDPAFAPLPLRGIALPACHASPIKMCGAGSAPTAGEDKDLQEQLRLAIKEERYEDAARIRDAIRAHVSAKGATLPRDNRKEAASDVRERLRQREISRLRDIDPGGDNMATPF